MTDCRSGLTPHVCIGIGEEVCPWVRWNSQYCRHSLSCPISQALAQLKRERVEQAVSWKEKRVIVTSLEAGGQRSPRVHLCAAWRF